ncbi:histidine kinase N-terminal 7TM domain-containing protein [Haloterrigena alkaliphila]|uniref:histidine kinase n=1 Tax=Haloterrigena alkaliphila TaxID=2816475 RepID=A0A8A2VMM2_9EURY|nr:histidine kinase N-terminal 7TM domain-containing protein [Haloterrigena alkaliphila]QSW99398.1 ATP-binding protein [Haloterrigena alkaliphila]
MPTGSGLDPIQVIYAVAAVNSLILVGVLSRYRDRRAVLPLCALNLSTGLWAGSLFVVTNLEPGLLALVCFAAVFLGAGGATMMTLVFTLEYTGRERFVTPSILAALSIEPILAVLFVLVNPNELFYTLREDGLVDWGIAFWLHTGYSYVVLSVATVLMLGFLYRSRTLYRGQSAALLTGTVMAWVANAVYLFGPYELDTSPIGFLGASVLYAIAIVRYRLADITPIARDRVLDTVTDGIFVVDDRDRVIDANPVGRALLTDVDESPIGAGVDSLFADWPELQEEYQSLTATPEMAERELAVDGEYFLVRMTPIDDGRDRHLGWLFVVRDITERKRREEQLERQNERLEQFADLVSHDLRNPLTVADGYLEMARETDDDEEYLEEVAQAHERMETIIDDVLALAREGADVTDPEPIDLATVAERAWAGVETVDGSLEIDSSARLLADSDRLQRMFENLFRNSVEHGTEDEDHSLVVSVSVEDDPDRSTIAFSVADDGNGIPADQRERVFEDGYSTGDEGTGFGLSIVQQIAAAHGWSVTATESEAGGARFEFTGVERADGVEPDIDDSTLSSETLDPPSRRS